MTGPRCREPSPFGMPGPSWSACECSAARSGTPRAADRSVPPGSSCGPPSRSDPRRRPGRRSAPRRTRRGRCTGRRARGTRYGDPDALAAGGRLTHRGFDQVLSPRAPGPATHTGSARRTAPRRSPPPAAPTGASPASEASPAISPQKTRMGVCEPSASGSSLRAPASWRPEGDAPTGRTHSLVVPQFEGQHASLPQPAQRLPRRVRVAAQPGQGVPARGHGRGVVLGERDEGVQQQVARRRFPARRARRGSAARATSAMPTPLSSRAANWAAENASR